MSGGIRHFSDTNGVHAAPEETKEDMNPQAASSDGFLISDEMRKEIIEALQRIKKNPGEVKFSFLSAMCYDMGAPPPERVGRADPPQRAGDVQ